MSSEFDGEEEISLEDDIAAALDGALEAPEKPNAEADESRTYNRDDAGKFAKSEQDAAEQAAVDRGATPAEAKQAVAQGWRPPYWNDEQHTPWGALPEQVRGALEQREKAFYQHLEKLAEQRKPLEPFQGVLERLNPHTDQLRAAGIEPHAFVSQLVDAHSYLTSKPAEALLWLAETYGVSPADLYNQITQGQQQQPADPRYQALEQELNGLKQWKISWEQKEQERLQQEEAERTAALHAEVQKWAKDKPHFDAVRDTMSDLIKANPQRYNSLDTAYEHACKLHPDIAERIQADQRKANTSRARAAAASRGAPAPGGRSTSSPKQTVEDTVREALDGLI